MEDFYIDYADMDDIQRAYINRRTDRHMVVTGTAGSGKSVIALHKLRQVSTQGTYAIIVYTKSLKKYFVDGINAMIRDRQENYGEIVTLRSNRIFYYQEWKEWYANHRSIIVDHLIIDECQDFTAEQINEMRAFGRICFLFGDADQTIMDFNDKITMDPQQTATNLGVVVNRLYNNYRLTIETAKVVENVPKPQVDTDVSDDCVRHGEKPRLIKANSFNGQLDKIIEIIRNRALSNVGILLRYNTKEKAGSRSGAEWRSVQYVKEYFERKGITVEYKYNINKDTDMDLDFQSSNPKILTWWCAKGLQFKDVFVVDCDYDYVAHCQTRKDQRREASAWYVALSRTSERLYICYTGTLSGRFPTPTSDLFSNPDVGATNNDDLPF
ncbi:MAG: AAA family ATPase [Bacteroidales bacterium]|nr:AAA family ATPase [Bacteroidales bacterium]